MVLTEKEKWRAVTECDSSYDGIFYYGVKSTGIVCRPSCKSKEPKRKNVQFFDNMKHALTAGFRPCKRCRPELIEYNPAADLAKDIKNIYDNLYTDREMLSQEIGRLGVSSNHLIKIFRQQYSMTPVEYINKLRIKKARKLLAENKYNILDIAFSCGFGSLSNFYTFFKKQVGMTPKEYSNKNYV